MSKIRAARLAKGMTLQQVADALGVSGAQVSRWENGQSAVPMKRMEALGRLYGVVPTFLMDWDTSLPSNAEPFLMEGASERRMHEDLPIFGSALGAPKIIDDMSIEQTTLNTGEILQYAKRPVILDGRADAYGLYVQGSSMEPVHLAGDLVLAETKRPARVGDDVIVYLRPRDDSDDGERARSVLIKRLVRRTANHIELEQFNPAMTFRVPADDVLRIDRTLRLADLIS